MAETDGHHEPGVDAATGAEEPVALEASVRQGAATSFATDEQRRAALNHAFDYRGDVTVELTDGRRVEGYVFDRRMEGADPYVRIMPADGGVRLSLRYAEIAGLVFSGRDPAAGKSWETWVRKYVEKKRKGEPANRDPDPLE